MLSRNNVWVLLLPLMLASCGFQPLYAKKTGAGQPAMLAGVRVEEVVKSNRLNQEFNDDVRMRQQLRSDLEDHLNPGGVVPPNPVYRLTATLSESEAGIGQSRDGTISRYNIYLDSTYTLYRISDNKAVTTGSLRQVGSYNNVINAYFSTYEAQQDAIKRDVTELAELYRTRLAAYLTGPDSGKTDQTVTTPKDPKTPDFPILPVRINTNTQP